MRETKRSHENNPEPYEDMLRLENLDPYEAQIKLNNFLEQNSKPSE